MPHQNFTFLNKKGFVFLFELLIAIGLAAAFLTVSSVQELETGEILTKIQEKQRSNDILTTLDENGFLLQKLDENTSEDKKMQDIYNEIIRLLPASVGARIEMDVFDVNTTKCKTTETFENCFSKVEGLYNSKGPNIPNDESVTLETLILVKKQPPQLCQVIDPPEFEEKKIMTKSPFKIFFGEDETIEPLKLYFSHQEGHDANVIFDLNTTPSNNLQCDEDLRFDLGAKVIDFGRNPVDIMLVQDRSGSMDEFTVNLQTLASGAFNAGTRQCSGFFCWWCTPTNWQNLTQFDLTSGQDYAVKMVDHNHSGARPCLFASTPPYLELENPSGSQPSNRDTEVILRTPFVSGTYTAWGWSQEWIGYDLNLYENKMTASQRAAKDFVDDAEWNEPDDRLGLASFASSGRLDEQLQAADDQNKQDIKDAIDALNSSGATAIGEGIDEATDELLGPRLNDNSTKFQIVLSDGQNNSGVNPLTAAQRAADNNIVIYTIAFGQDADQDTLREIADITDGNFYYADEDENALDDIYSIIRDDIGNRAGGEDSWAYDANLTVPVNLNADVISTGGGTLQTGVDRNYIYYDIGDITPNTPWNDFFTINYPCDQDLTCSVKSVKFSEEPFYLEYDNKDGTPGNPLLWDQNADLNFQYRDLTVKIINAKIVASETVFLDVNAINAGHLNSGETTLDFYLDDPDTGTFVRQNVVPAMCGELGAGCTNYFTLYLDELIEADGWIYVIIDKDDNIAECPGNNVAEIFCSTGPRTQYFVLKLWTWAK